MTNITGKIYQQTNDDGTENRFPKTVVPAVIGLSQYLQDQFNTLSDLYMPKEGESETLTGQEITYRKSEATINAKTVTIDRIYGKTLVWNQMLNASAQGDSRISYSGGKIILSSGTVSNYAYTLINSSDYPLKFISGHKYCVIGAERWRELLSGYNVSLHIPNSAWDGSGGIVVDGVYTCTNTGNFFIYLFYPGNTVFPNASFSIEIYDLTLMFGAGNEPNTNEFRALYPGYYGYSAGKLISNDAESIKTVGFNQCDENNFEPGAIAGSSGWNTSGFDDKRVRSRDYIRCLSNTNYYANFVRNTYSSYVRIFWYDSEKKFVAQTNNNGISTSPSNAKYMRVQTEGSDYGGAYKNDIIVNISDTDRNGQYEPHYKSELKLNLNSIKVKSHNIWDEEWDLKNRELNGSENASSYYLTNKNPIKALPNKEYYFYSEHPTRSDRQVYYLEWNSSLSLINRAKMDSSLISATNSKFAFRYTTSSSAAYIGLFIYSGTAWSDTDISNARLCVNISSSFNGFYEPHGIITINGLKSTPNGIDEIIGNKFIKRNDRAVFDGTETWLFPGSDYHWPYTPEIKGLDNESQVPVCNLYIGKAGASGFPGEGFCKLLNGNFGFAINPGSHNSTISEWTTYLASLYSAGTPLEVVYPLATPIEYELVEPLTYTFKAGTTEERISPNSDGLSAPFCCDLTYNASETAGVLDALQGLSRKLELIEERLARLEDNG